MLVGLTIHDIVLIDRLDVKFDAGLCVLTGETGAGKSIILDAMNLTTGARGDANLVRKGAKQGSAVAEFEVAPDHPARRILFEQELEADGNLLLRRTLGSDGRSRAFVNDQPVSIGLLRRIGECLVEVHGQHDDRGLFNAAGHRLLLDGYGGLEPAAAKVEAGYQDLLAAREAREQAEAEITAARREEEYLRHAVEELDSLAPVAGEDQQLAVARSLMMHGEKLAEELAEVAEALGEEGGIESRLRGAHRRLQRAAERIEGGATVLDAAVAALERSSLEATEAVAAVDAAARGLSFDAGELDRAESRLFALRAAARKYNCEVDDLAVLQVDLSQQLVAIDDSAGRVAALAQKEAAAEKSFRAAATVLSKARVKAAARLGKGVNGELPPLKLEKATFHVHLSPLEPEDWGPGGAERVEFQVSTNPGAPVGPLGRIASGGELSRFMLALKVVLAKEGSAASLIFDEVDRGIGGAVANAVGERLAALAVDTQVLVVTHSPQVAARATHHWRIEKTDGGEAALTSMVSLAGEARREEIARMLSGARITDEARAAADQLLGQTEVKSIFRS